MLLIIGDFQRYEDEPSYVKHLRRSEHSFFSSSFSTAVGSSRFAKMANRKQQERCVTGFRLNNVPKSYHIRQIKDHEDWIWDNSVSGVGKDDLLICLDNTISQLRPRLGYVYGYRKSTIDKIKEKGINVSVIDNPSQRQLKQAWESSLSSPSTW